MSKNNSINFWRILFTMSIVTLHFSGTYEQFNTIFGAKNGWRIAVEFFFVVSGFLLAYKCENSDLTAWEYTKHRFKRLFPAYLITTLLMTVFRIIDSGMTAKEAGTFIINLNDELLMLQGLAFNYVAANGPSWYVSSLIICGYFVFYLLRRYKDLFSHFIAPLMCIVIYSYISQKLGSLEAFTYDFTDVLGISIAILRGIGGLCAGVMSYELYKILKNLKLTKLGTSTAHFIEVVGFCFVLVYSFFTGSTRMDFMFVVIFIICVALGFSREKKSAVFNNEVTDFLSKISFSIYLTHMFVINIFSKLYSPKNYSSIMFIIFLISTIATGALCELAASSAVKYLDSKSKKRGGFFVKEPVRSRGKRR